MVSILINSLAGGGAEKVVLTLVKELRRAGVGVELILIERERFYDLPKGVEVHYLTRYKAIKNPLLKFLYVFICAWRLKQHVQQRGTEYVQSHLIRSNYINVLAQMMGGKHQTQIVNHMMASFDTKRGLLGKVNIALYKKLYAKADMIVSISKVMKKDLDEYFEVENPERHMVIYNPHDVDHIRELAAQRTEKFQFDPSKRYLASVGRLVARKRVDLLIRALAELREEDPSVELLVLGSGEMMEHYQQVTKELKLEPYVHFLGHVSNPFAYLARADVFVLASEDEGLPNIIIESMICGTAVVSTDCKSGPRETLSPSSDINLYLTDEVEVAEFGILCPVGRHDTLAEALRRMLSDEALREAYVQKGLARAEDFRSNKVARTYMQTFGLEPREEAVSV